MTLVADAPATLPTRSNITGPVCDLATALIRLTEDNTALRPSLSGDLTVAAGDTKYWCVVRTRSTFDTGDVRLSVDITALTDMTQASMELTERVNAALRGMLAHGRREVNDRDGEIKRGHIRISFAPANRPR